MLATCSAILTDRYLKIIVSYGDENTNVAHPERVNKIRVEIKSEKAISIRTFSFDDSFGNSNGDFSCGTILAPEELAKSVHAALDTLDGIFNTHCTITPASNTVTSHQF